MSDDVPENDNTAVLIIRRYEELRKANPNDPLTHCVRILNGGRVMIKTPYDFDRKFNDDGTYRKGILNYSEALENAIKGTEII